MNGENLIEQACGFYDEWHQLLSEGYITLDEVKAWYRKGFIKKEQYEFAKDYLKGS